ncbi:hypothetical protein [uncultured Clostridium sp.]|uniref:hypothetical protein n=1 Tax=uncultured Clostridium sp. TaxID=59620 RepID=UPI0025E8B033|nr:hypothetical protein [uncultured Clostridium sp.]MDU4883107.1 hypothetical protein [Clostridium celatum]MDU7076173.1 hypothetical protein [Clostridium celatum]
MINKNSENKRISREFLANHFPLSTRKKRMKKAEAIDLRENCIIKEYNNEYFEFIPINKDKKV